MMAMSSWFNDKGKAGQSVAQFCVKQIISLNDGQSKSSRNGSIALWECYLIIFNAGKKHTHSLSPSCFITPAIVGRTNASLLLESFRAWSLHLI
jgi:hypothetical protein